jgi:hypothetical protein
MAHFTIISSPDNEKKGWRPCAILNTSTIESAAQQAKSLRTSGGLAFVSKPARFKIRRSTRTEMRLMMAFFHSFGSLNSIVGSDSDKDVFFARRQKLLLSFFMGIFIDFEAMKKRYLPDGSDGDTIVKKSSSGGAETEGLEDSKKLEEELKQAIAAEILSESALSESEGTHDSGNEGILDSDDSDSSGPIGDTNQEDALAQILASSEANDGGKSRDESIDLDIL